MIGKCLIKKKKKKKNIRGTGGRGLSTPQIAKTAAFREYEGGTRDGVGVD